MIVKNRDTKLLFHIAVSLIPFWLVSAYSLFFPPLWDGIFDLQESEAITNGAIASALFLSIIIFGFVLRDPLREFTLKVMFSVSSAMWYSFVWIGNFLLAEYNLLFFLVSIPLHVLFVWIIFPGPAENGSELT